MNTTLFSFSGSMLDLSSLEKISVVENIHLSGTDDELVPR